MEDGSPIRVFLFKFLFHSGQRAVQKIGPGKERKGKYLQKSLVRKLKYLQRRKDDEIELPDDRHVVGSDPSPVQVFGDRHRAVTSQKLMEVMQGPRVRTFPRISPFTHLCPPWFSTQLNPKIASCPALKWLNPHQRCAIGNSRL